MRHYDAIVIGAGQGGNPLAHKLADLGRRVALVEREHLGGSCINYGCTPTKTMLASARAAHVARRAGNLGVRTGDVSVDLAAVVARKDEIVRQWRHGQEEQAARRPTLDLYRAHGRFVDARTVRAGDAVLRAEHIFIDTGTRPRIPVLRGLDEVPVLTNRTVMELTAPPGHLLVLGGGYVGLEIGQMFRRFGSDVTVVEHGDRIIGREDPELSDALQRALEAEGMRIRVGVTARAAAPAPGGIELTVTSRDGGTETVVGTHLLAATGRLPNTDDLGLDAAGVETDCRGYVQVDERLETNVPGIWALGDVKGGPAFTHISYDDHLVIYDHLAGRGERTTRDRQIPYALYTDPELGRVGLTERQAREAGHRLKVGSIPMSRVARAVERGETEGLMKVVIDADTDRILGAAVLGAEGGELVQTLMAVMMADAPWTLLKRGVYIHPTLTEGLFHLMEEVQPREDSADT